MRVRETNGAQTRVSGKLTDVRHFGEWVSRLHADAHDVVNLYVGLAVDGYARYGGHLYTVVRSEGWAA